MWRINKCLDLSHLKALASNALNIMPFFSQLGNFTFAVYNFVFISKDEVCVCACVCV